jgi:hypothetical protein
MRLEHWLNAIALVIGFVSALLMFFWTPKLEEYHADGSRFTVSRSSRSRRGGARSASPSTRGSGLPGPSCSRSPSCCSSRP